MNIYIVDNIDYYSVGAFSTRELAQAYIDGLAEGDRWTYGITVATLDVPISH